MEKNVFVELIMQSDKKTVEEIKQLLIPSQEEIQPSS